MPAKLRVKVAKTLQAVHFLANVLNGVERRLHQGAWYVVAPAVLCREKVLNGELMTADALSRSIAASQDPSTSSPESLKNLWEGLPVTIRHPPDRLSTLSENLDWLEANRVGFVSNVQMSDAKLVGEIWLPLEQGDPEAARTLENIEAGKVTEVSIGSYNLVIPTSGNFEGDDFAGVIIEAAPNHLALLPDQTGACSVKAGCGIPRAAAVNNVRDLARKPTFEGTSARAWSEVDTSLRAYVRAAASALSMDVDEKSSVEDLPLPIKQWIAARTLLGEATATTRDELLAFPVVEPDTGKLNRNALYGSVGGRSTLASVGEAAKRSARQRAVDLIASEFGVAILDGASDKERGSMPEELSKKLVAKTGFCGRRFAAVVAEVVKMSDLTEDQVVERVASATDFSADVVRQAIQGDGEIVTDKMVESFAVVLDLSPSLLFAAASEDVRQFLRSLEDGPQAEPVFFSEADKGFGQKLMARLEGLGALIQSKLGGQSVMEKNELVKSAMARFDVKSDEEKAALEALPVSMLERFCKEPEEKATPAASGGDNPEPVAAAGNQEESSKKKLSFDDLDDDLKAEFKELRAQRETRKTDLVSKLKGQMGLSEEDLGEIPVATLEKMASKLRPVDYSLAMGGGVAGVGGASDEEARTEAIEGSPTPYDSLTKDAVQ